MSVTMDKKSFRWYWFKGEPFVWLTASAVVFVILALVGMLLVIMGNGLGYYWPGDLTQVTGEDNQVYLGRRLNLEVDASGNKQRRYKIGNRDIYGFDFVWLAEDSRTSETDAEEAILLERLEYGNLHAFLHVGESQNFDTAWSEFESTMEAVQAQRETYEETEDELTEINRSIEQLEKKEQKLKYSGTDSDALDAIRSRLATLKDEFEVLRTRLVELEVRQKATALFVLPDGKQVEIPMMGIVRAVRPNKMNVLQKTGFYMSHVWELLTEEPRESNTEGGIFPAIFGTVAMVFLMALFSIPLGVITAIYLREYAHDGPLLRIIRISVNNLAGVPSIVYGVFGLGFFIYTVGAAIDQVFFPHLLPTPTFGTGGILWASLTLAILTVPVVIVATEESLAAIPKEIREASLALGATRFQTLVRVLLPMSTPGILTGMILSMARAAGEVAPLMLTGAVKLAPSLPLDGTSPYVHLERKFMHLGFHIYDLAFQSPNVEAVLPMVYVTTGLLLIIVVVLSIVAMTLRNRMRKKYASGVF